MTATPRLAVFDVDGTLVDSQHNIVAAMTAAYRSHGLGDPLPADVRRIIGLSLVEAVAQLLPDRDGDLHLAVAHAYKDAFFTLRARSDHSEPLFPGAAAALDRLEADGWLLGIATGNTRRGLDAMIERHGFQGRFVSLQTADDNPGKPSPDMVLNALADAGVAADAAVMIGDTTFDMIMGRRARVHTLGVAWGYHPREHLLAVGAEAVADDYRELPAAVTLLLGRTACASG